MTVRPPSPARRLLASLAVRRGLVLVLLAVAWEVAARVQNNPIMFPSFLETAAAFHAAVLDGRLLPAVGGSLAVLVEGYLIALAIGVVLVSLAVANSFLRDALQTVAAMLNPLPAIALLPLAMLWFGLGLGSLLFVLVNAVIWPFALAALSGFEAVPETHRLVGRNYGLKGPAYVIRILIPSALPQLISGLRIGWAFAWRTLIAAELVFGVNSGQGGLGWFIFRARNELFTDTVFAGLAAVILIGLLVEAVVFRGLETVTVRRWGMLR
ncbi:ABC transporter permease [Zavarzinia compransoris]|uniref:ABC transporter permease n=1 Tax=Zavarzinia compransoris TaxID=1264899 RepID=A0A317DYE6_9PROT|nr:ABC transporter permease [Zavarzinia compransoris]PWR19767.1 ABC transporter permease [Zavarzinia compransoris]TDP45131.1 NitT/TauT family transport system permease protein [Zavarzinia compransoris]